MAVSGNDLPVRVIKHCYLADGFWQEWLENIDRLERELASDATLNIGHGEPAKPALFAWQRGYIENFIDAVKKANWSNPEQSKVEVVAKAKEYLPSDDLAFLMELSVEPVAAKMGRAARGSLTRSCGDHGPCPPLGDKGASRSLCGDSRRFVP